MNFSILISNISKKMSSLASLETNVIFKNFLVLLHSVFFLYIPFNILFFLCTHLYIKLAEAINFLCLESLIFKVKYFCIHDHLKDVLELIHILKISRSERIQHDAPSNL